MKLTKFQNVLYDPLKSQIDPLRFRKDRRFRIK